MTRESSARKMIHIQCQALFFSEKKKIKVLSAVVVISALTHCSLQTPKRVIGKQCRPISDAAECGN